MVAAITAQNRRIRYEEHGSACDDRGLMALHVHRCVGPGNHYFNKNDVELNDDLNFHSFGFNVLKNQDACAILAKHSAE